ncbi:MAG: ribulose-phosphate 3-epimerase, partial [Cyclobacteriaceae bacterium]
PNISMGFPVLDAIHRHAKKPLDVHLMIVNPDQYLEKVQNAGAFNITVHIEVCDHLCRTIDVIKKLGCKAGVALNPHTPVYLLKDIIRDLDLICMMSVNPGFGGQNFIENTYQKVKSLSTLIVESGSHAKIEIDGGVSMENAKKLFDIGAHVLVAGNFVFSSKNPQETINNLKNIV